MNDGPFCWLFSPTSPEVQRKLREERRRQELKTRMWLAMSCGLFLLFVLICSGLSLYGLYRAVAG